MSPYLVEIERLPSMPIVVIRRQMAVSELSRVVPECCGVVWNEVRAQQVPAGRHVAVYWCQANGHRLAGPSWEIYGHWLPEWDANPSRIRTDLYHLLAAEAGGERP
jgi:DNA gyrase inhibitor GyrI